MSGDRETRYADLADRVRRLAGLLRSRGVGPENAVGVALHRGTDLVATVLAVLTAGGVYVPLAPEHPAERLAHLIDDAEVTLLVTEEALSGRLPAHPNTLVLDAVRPRESEQAPSLEPEGVVGTRAAYVMYTSGSTGRPKGVVVPEAAIRNRVSARPRPPRWSAPAGPCCARSAHRCASTAPAATGFHRNCA
ncbi:AMP-binding protein [Streptomyces sp. NPDC048342]|uniref:AMP-binding protein n=1 Tax=unclassified Streptomyces TaxID=2593676 RepID=UPI0034234398